MLNIYDVILYCLSISHTAWVHKVIFFNRDRFKSWFYTHTVHRNLKMREKITFSISTTHITSPTHIRRICMKNEFIACDVQYFFEFHFFYRVEKRLFRHCNHELKLCALNLTLSVCESKNMCLRVDLFVSMLHKQTRFEFATKHPLQNLSFLQIPNFLQTFHPMSKLNWKITIWNNTKIRWCREIDENI
jgi:hypothetical protein